MATKYYYGIGKNIINRGIFEASSGLKLKVSDWAEVETELGKIGYQIVTPKQKLDKDETVVGKVNRKIDADEIDYDEEEDQERLLIFQEKIDKYNLPMKPVAAVETVDQDRIIFYFTAPERVDFRRLVKDLASYFHKLIRLQQVNERSAAMAKGGVGPCGRKLCCLNRKMEIPAEVKSNLIDEQGLKGVDKAKLSGACGKLVCCLKFEEQQYRELLKGLPKIGDKISKRGIKGEVINVDPLNKKIRVRTETKEEKEINLKK